MKALLLTLALLATPALALDINDASREELVTAGFSTTDADRIIAARTANGAFSSSRDLLRIEGISQGDLNRVRGKLTIAGEDVTTRSGTAPAIPGERPAIAGKKSGTDDASRTGQHQENESEHASGDDHSHDSSGKAEKDSSSKSSDSKEGQEKDSSGKGGDSKDGKEKGDSGKGKGRG